MIERKAKVAVNEWITHGNDAFLLTGARQIGKTYLIRQCLKESGYPYIEFNFIEQPELVNLFAGAKDAKELLMRLSVVAKEPLEQVGVDEYYSEVLPEDKAKFVEAEKTAGRKVIMVGDGINDSPALSASDAGIAVSDGAEIAREIADITVSADNLYELVTLKELSNKLMSRINRNYRKIVTINTGLIILGVMGVIQPTTSALLHNSSTLLISLDSMKKLLD